MIESSWNARKWIAALECAGYTVCWDKDMLGYTVLVDGVFVTTLSDVVMRYAKFDVVEWVDDKAEERGLSL